MLNQEMVLEIFPNDIKIYQSENLYKFTKDAIELAKFVKTKKTDSVLDMCAGVGVVGLYAYAISSFKKLYFVELQPKMCEIIQKNIELNNLQDRTKCINVDLRDLKSSDFGHKIDMAVCNPPYFKLEDGSKLSVNFKYDKTKKWTLLSDLQNSDLTEKEVSEICAKHEIFANFEDIVKTAKRILKPNGKLCTMGVPSRMCEMVLVLNKYGFECKRIKINKNKNKANLVLIEAVLNGRSGVDVTIG